MTGHRPEDLPNQEWVEAELKRTYLELKPELIYTGMAAGIDLLSAEVAHSLNIPYVATKPWAGHTPRIEDRIRYSTIEENADSVVNVDPSQTYPGVWVYHNRNVYMVDNSDFLIAVWSGKTKGGTYACVKYARQKQKPIYQINPIDMTSNWLIPFPKDDSSDRLF